MYKNNKYNTEPLPHYTKTTEFDYSVADISFI